LCKLIIIIITFEKASEELDRRKAYKGLGIEENRGIEHANDKDK
jgi:hypothetical protein